MQPCLTWSLTYQACALCSDSVILILSTGYVLGWLTAMILNLILPTEKDPYEALRQARYRGELPMTAMPGMRLAVSPACGSCAAESDYFAAYPLLCSLCLSPAG